VGRIEVAMGMASSSSSSVSEWVSECCGWWWRMNEWMRFEKKHKKRKEWNGIESNNLGLPKQGFTM
jgi:hypothetical protein